MADFKMAIVDELGEVKHWCSELSKEEIEEILNAHPEWKRAFIEW